MDSEEERAATAAPCHCSRCNILKRRRKRKKRYAWVKPWLQRREQFGAYDTLLRELRSEDESEYRTFLRMSPAAFDEVLDMLEGDITKENTVMRAAVPAKIKLAATLRFLATGSTCADLQYTFRVHKSTLTAIIPEVCDAIYARLKGDGDHNPGKSWNVLDFFSSWKGCT